MPDGDEGFWDRQDAIARAHFNVSRGAAAMKSILWAINRFAGKDGVCDASVETLDVASGVSRTRRKAILKTLKKRGVITIVVGGGRSHCNKIRINADALRALAAPERGPSLTSFVEPETGPSEDPFSKHGGRFEHERGPSGAQKGAVGDPRKCESNTKVVTAKPLLETTSLRTGDSNSLFPQPATNELNDDAGAHCNDFQHFVEAWNGLPSVRRCLKATPARKKAFRVRQSEHDWNWHEAFKAFPLKCFAAGDWLPDIDWFLRPYTVLQILEGKYDWTRNSRRTTRKGASNGAPADVADELDDIWARLYRRITQLDFSRTYTHILTKEFGERVTGCLRDKLRVVAIREANEYQLRQELKPLFMQRYMEAAR